EKRLKSVFAPPLYTVEKDTVNTWEGIHHFFNIFLRGEPLFEVYLYRPDSGPVLSVAISLKKDYLNNPHEAKYHDYSFAEIHMMVGRPSFVAINQVDPNDAANSFLYYRKSGGYFIVASYHTKMQRPLIDHIVYGLAFEDPKIVDQQGSIGSVSWRGFIPFQEYIREVCSGGTC